MFGKMKVRAEAYKAMFGSEAGKYVLYDLAKICNAYSSSHVSGDPIQTALNEGKREVYLYIMRILEASDMDAHKRYIQQVGNEQLQTQQELDIYD